MIKIKGLASWIFDFTKHVFRSIRCYRLWFSFNVFFFWFSFTRSLILFLSLSIVYQVGCLCDFVLWMRLKHEMFPYRTTISETVGKAKRLLQRRNRNRNEINKNKTDHNRIMSYTSVYYALFALLCCDYRTEIIGSVGRSVDRLWSYKFTEWE